jgi:hypothetical protein
MTYFWAVSNALTFVLAFGRRTFPERRGLSIFNKTPLARPCQGDCFGRGLA